MQDRPDAERRRAWSVRGSRSGTSRCPIGKKSARGPIHRPPCGESLLCGGSEGTPRQFLAVTACEGRLLWGAPPGTPHSSDYSSPARRCEPAGSGSDGAFTPVPWDLEDIVRCPDPSGASDAGRGPAQIRLPVSRPSALSAVGGTSVWTVFGPGRRCPVHGASVSGECVSGLAGSGCRLGGDDEVGCVGAGSGVPVGAGDQGEEGPGGGHSRRPGRLLPSRQRRCRPLRPRLG